MERILTHMSSTTCIGSGQIKNERCRGPKMPDKPYKFAIQRGSNIEVTFAGGKLWRFWYQIGKIE